VFKRLRGYNEPQLVLMLEKETREIDIEAVKGTSKTILDEAKKPEPKELSQPRDDKDRPHPLAHSKLVPEMIARRDDLKGLPLRLGAECQVTAKEAATIQNVSEAVRSAGSRGRRGEDTESNLANRREVELLKILAGVKPGQDSTVRTLIQMLQADSEQMRLDLVNKLSELKEKPVTEALAQRAVFDLSAKVRQAAVKALEVRPDKDFQPVLLKGLRYPWPVVAEHAAEALVALDRKIALPDLVDLLDQPDPRAPSQDKDNRWMVAEVVRANHLKNCFLCHAPSVSAKDPIRGIVPERGRPLPRMYYEGDSDDPFIRADVTYLRQDFSVTQFVPNSDKWPIWQRFDYLVRQREVSAKEAAKLAPVKDRDGKLPSYPQREAVLWALRELTGKDVGDRKEDWIALMRKRSSARD
jgi:hypothetical protein